MNEYKIEKGIKIPLKADESLTSLFRQLQIGDSILLPGNRRNSISQTAKALGIDVVSRTVDKATGQFRVWRVERHAEDGGIDSSAFDLNGSGN